MVSNETMVNYKVIDLFEYYNFGLDYFFHPKSFGNF
jgi:hypothetical protein